MKTINGHRFVKENGIYHMKKEGPSSRRNSWITLDQTDKEYPEFIDKISEILYYKEYNEKAKEFARSILVWLDLWGFVSWKQFDSIFGICKTYDEYKKALTNGTRIFRYRNVIMMKRAKVACTFRDTTRIPSLSTDREFDKFHEFLFGHPPVFEEEVEDGMTKCYRSDGSRYFALTGDMDISDFIDY
jgi:hypothetical protein